MLTEEKFLNLIIKNLWVNTPSQNLTCSTFIKDKILFLLSSITQQTTSNDCFMAILFEIVIIYNSTVTKHLNYSSIITIICILYVSPGVPVKNDKWIIFCYSLLLFQKVIKVCMLTCYDQGEHYGT